MHESTGLIFEAENGWSLKITTDVWDKMNLFIQHSDTDHESGGVLLGRFIKEATVVVVDEITTPQRLDKSSPTRFIRKQEGHQGLIEKFWQKSNGTCNYLGEWHTHPEDFPMPSTTDISNWARLARKTRQESSDLFFIIVGRQGLSAHHISRKSLKITELHVKA